MKGGRQDRTLGVDFVLPPKSGRVPVLSFCVESGRWHRRASEDAGSFSSRVENIDCRMNPAYCQTAFRVEDRNLFLVNCACGASVPLGEGKPRIT